jgi:outer membrane protein TolC
MREKGESMRMKGHLVWAVCSSLLWGGVAQAIQSDSSVYSQAVSMTAESDLDYPELKKRILTRYDHFVKQLVASEESYKPIFMSMQNEGGMPAEFAPWWQAGVNSVLNSKVEQVDTDVNSLFVNALNHSSQLKVFSDLPLIRETTIQEAQGEFDFTFFAEASVSAIDEPVGDDLRTGGPLRYEEDSHNVEYGLQKKFSLGTEVELSQNVGAMDTNSTYFNPRDQARTGTTLTITQPLLKRFGVTYNDAPIELARIDHEVATEEFRRSVESHLLEVSRAYWELYLERSLLLQKSRLAEKSSTILKQMQERVSVDVPPSLLARAKSQANAHDLAAMQAEYAVLNAQSRIRALVNAPAYLNGNGLEMVTRQLPSNSLLEYPYMTVLETAMANRPEIDQGIHHIQSAAIRLQRSKNELLPDLDLVAETYVLGFEGDYEYGTSYSNQFDTGSPSYSVGLRLEYPFGNNEAEARNQRKKIEIRQLMRQLDTTIENVLLEAQVSYREMIKNYRSMVQSYQVMLADKEEVEALKSRIDYLLSKNDNYGDVLYRLMDASERLTKSEESYVKSELSYNYSLTNLFRVMGILVRDNKITTERQIDSDTLPVLHMEKNEK